MVLEKTLADPDARIGVTAQHRAIGRVTLAVFGVAAANLARV